MFVLATSKLTQACRRNHTKVQDLKNDNFDEFFIEVRNQIFQLSTAFSSGLLGLYVFQIE